MNSKSFAETLQYLCIKVISKDEKAIEVSQFYIFFPLMPYDFPIPYHARTNPHPLLSSEM